MGETETEHGYVYLTHDILIYAFPLRFRYSSASLCNSSSIFAPLLGSFL